MVGVCVRDEPSHGSLEGWRPTTLALGDHASDDSQGSEGKSEQEHALTF